MKNGMKVIAIAAVGKNGVIGVNAESGMTLPWNIPEDMKFFKDSTREQIVLMGRKTFQALGKALPKRENAVLTRDAFFKAPQATVFADIELAISHYQHDEQFKGKTLFVIGGAEIYKLAVPHLDEIWLTEIDAEFEGNVYFPFYENGKLNLPQFNQAKLITSQEDTQSPYRYRFVCYSK